MRCACFVDVRDSFRDMLHNLGEIPEISLSGSTIPHFLWVKGIISMGVPVQILMAEEARATWCWHKFKAGLAFAQFSAFRVSFTTGTLDPETSSRCILQDRHFLNAFAQAFKWAADCVENEYDEKAIIESRNLAPQKFKKNEILVQASSIYTEDLLANLNTSLTNVEVDEMKNLSLQALNLQVEFFAGQLISQQTPVPLSHAMEFRNQKLTIFCNFDLTCSIFHSIATPLEVPSSGFQAVKTAHDSLSTQNVAEGKKYDYNGLHGSLEQVAEVEKMAIARVEMLAILRNLTQQTIKFVGKRIAKIGRSNIHAHVISHCWPSELIREAFSSDFDVLKAHLNELAYVTTGETIRKVESLLQKLPSLKEVLKHEKSKAEHLIDCIGRKSRHSHFAEFKCKSEETWLSVAAEFVPQFPTLAEKQKELAKDSSPI